MMAVDERKSASVASRTVSGGFKTSEGTLYVSKPFRSKSSKTLRAMITFAPRKSHFDTTNESSGTNEFRVSNLLDQSRLCGSTRSLGILLLVLDLDVSVYCPHLCPQY